VRGSGLVPDPRTFQAVNPLFHRNRTLGVVVLI
jgi:hypothetical protein